MVFERFKGYLERLRGLPEELGNEELSFVVGMVGSLGSCIKCNKEDCDCACQNLVDLVKAAFPFGRSPSLRKILED